MPWTEQQIVDLLDRNDRAVEKAIVAIYERQTADEKSAEHTRHDNQVGFRQNHAKRMSYYARLIKSGKHLYPRQLELSRTWMKMYRKQLADIANKKEAAAFKTPAVSASAIDRMARINAEEDERERRKANFLGNEETVPRDPPPGTWAETARAMAGLFPDFDWDAWKDEMKERGDD
jgi:hypothetical protein